MEQVEAAADFTEVSFTSKRWEKFGTTWSFRAVREGVQDYLQLLYEGGTESRLWREILQKGVVLPGVAQKRSELRRPLCRLVERNFKTKAKATACFGQFLKP